MASYSMSPAQLAPATSAAFRRSFAAWHKRVAQAARGLPTGGAARILSEDVEIEATEKRGGVHVIRYTGADGGAGIIRINVPEINAPLGTVERYETARNALLSKLTRGTGPIARTAADSAPVESAAPVPVPVAPAPVPVAPAPNAPADVTALADAIRAAGGSAGNLALRDRLAWEVARYDAAKGALLSAGTVRAGRGRGGSLYLVESAAPVTGDELSALREQLIFSQRDERAARETVDRLLLERDSLIAERDNALAAADTDAADLVLAHAEIARLRAQVAGLLSARTDAPSVAHLPAVAVLATQGRA